MSEWAICSKKQVIQSFAHFWWATWANHSLRSFLVSNLSDLLASLIKKEWMSKLLVFCEWKSKWVICSKKRAICSFIMSDLSESLTVAHLSWAIWANRTQLLIWSEGSEQMSKWANSQPCAFHTVADLTCSWSWSKIWGRIDWQVGANPPSSLSFWASTLPAAAYWSNNVWRVVLPATDPPPLPTFGWCEWVLFFFCTICYSVGF